VSELLVVDLGTLPYSTALELQRDAARRRISGEIPEDVLLLVEHPPVVTLGRTAKGANLVASPALLASQGVELFEVERGGDITFHGPGQLVGYPIFDLKRHRKDLHWYLRQLEEALIGAMAELQIHAGRVGGHTGVWTTAGGELGTGNREPMFVTGSESRFPLPGSLFPLSTSRKLASIGVHARDWVTWHGFALNVNTDLRYFDLIVPCGISGVTMTSVARELNMGSVDMRAVGDAVVRAFGRTFGLLPRAIDGLDVGLDTAAAIATPER
jgi:lipoyl(octanoyl) transferase